MTSRVRRCTRCVDENGERVLMAGHRCPYRQDKTTVHVDNVDTPPFSFAPTSFEGEGASGQGLSVDSPSSTAASTPASSPLDAPFNPTSIHAKIAIHADYTVHSFDSFSPSGFVDTTSSPMVPQPAYPDLDYAAPFQSTPDGSFDVDSLNGLLNDPSIDLSDISIDDELLAAMLPPEQLEELLSDQLGSILNLSPSAPGSPQPVSDSLSPVVGDVGVAANVAISGPITTGLGGALPDAIQTASVNSPAAGSVDPVDDSDDVVMTDIQDDYVLVDEPGNRKRKRSHADEDDSNRLEFIQNPVARRKAHSKRTNNIMKKIRELHVVSRPYVMVYIARPESVCLPNGTASSFMSNNLKQIFGEDFLDDIHDKVVASTHNNNIQKAIDTNKEVERLRQEKLEEEERRKEAEKQRKQAEAEAATLRAQVAALQVSV